MDRTGTVEKKREQRMKQAGKFEEKVETYNSLVMSFCLLIYTFLIILQIYLQLDIDCFRLRSITKL